MAGNLDVDEVVDGRFRIERLVGSGSCGLVYKAWEERLQRPVAIKCLKLSNLQDRFRQEGCVLARLSVMHPDFVQVYSSGVTSRNDPYLVMQWLEGKDLDQVLEERVASGLCYNEREALDLLASAIWAMSVAHTQNPPVVHCDIKPGNLFVADANGRLCLKVLDFGIAELMHDMKAVRAPGLLTPAYAAPEQSDPAHGQIGPWTDVFSLGMILLELVSGTTPSIAAAWPSPIPVVGPGASRLHPKFVALVAKAVDFSPEKRFSDAGALATAVLEVRSHLTVANGPSAEALHRRVTLPAEQAPEHAAFAKAVDQWGWAHILPGAFQMGSPDHETGYRDEFQHWVRITGAYLLKATPVAQHEWRQVSSDARNGPQSSDGDLPITNVTWFECVAYCNELSRKCGLPPCYLRTDGTPYGFADAIACSEPVWGSVLGYRLPTEAEWEYAARAGTLTSFHSGQIKDATFRDSSLERVAWYRGNSEGRIHPVRRRLPNAWQLHDMLGNVCEWVWDRGGPASRYDQMNPVGPDQGSGRVFRGGSYRSPPSACRAAARNASEANRAHGDVGLRPCRSVAY